MPGNPLGDALAETFVTPTMRQIVERSISHLTLTVAFLPKPHFSLLEQAELIGRVESRIIEPLAEEIIASGDVTSYVTSRRSDQCLNFIQQFGIAELVGVNEQNPLIAN